MWRRNEDTDTEEVDGHGKRAQTDTNTHVLRCWKCLMERRRCRAEAWRMQSRTHRTRSHTLFPCLEKHLYWVWKAAAARG